MHDVVTIAPAPVEVAPWLATATAANRFMAQHFAGYVILPLPKWQSSAVHFGPRAVPEMSRPRHHRFRPRCTVSDASVTRSRRRAEAPRPAEVKPAWKRPGAAEPVAFVTQFDMLMDDELQDITRLDDEQVDKDMFRATVAERRRIYSDDELATVERWHKGLFSQVRFDALDNP
jgi:hypothetical protein